MLKYLIILVLVKNIASQECGNSTTCKTFSSKMSIRIGKTQAICPNSIDYNKIAPPFIEVTDPTGPTLFWSVQCGGNFFLKKVLRTFGKESINTQPLDAGCSPTEDVFVWVYCPTTHPNCTIQLDFEEPFLVVKRPWGLGRINMTSPRTYLMFSQYMGKTREVNNFNKRWGDYVNGFCRFNSSCWIGLENLKTLMQYKMKLYVETAFTAYVVENIGSYYAQAFYYNLGLEGPNYQLVMKSPYYMGADDNAGYVRDDLLPAVGNYFSTVDNDNDKNSAENCAGLNGNSGWWFGDCKNVLAFTNGQFNNKWDIPRSLLFINFKAPPTPA